MTCIQDLDLIMREIRQRVTRIESRICHIGESLDIEMRSPKKGLDILCATDEVVELSTSVMDITLSELVSFLKKENLSDREVDIFFRGELIASLYPTGNPIDLGLRCSKNNNLSGDV